MPTFTFAHRSVHVTDDGYFRDPAEWTGEMAPDIAVREGLGQLDEDQWRVVWFLRESYLDGRRPPSTRVVSKHCDLSMRRLYEMFPRRPVKVAAKVAGVPEPRGYVGGCGVNWDSGWR